MMDIESELRYQLRIAEGRVLDLKADKDCLRSRLRTRTSALELSRLERDALQAQVKAGKGLVAIVERLQWDEYGRCRCGATQGENHGNDDDCSIWQALAAYRKATQ